ncbi:hypothetical protein FHL15_007591 [Xylaria flabelliformis]|uniref:Gfd2/YDR514C-like C-terminal domain-containing protein n=1 Tax=Xylaria flabelliformis TaxID=2512241 RepID=A0A553HUF2_9PEZI|nr:hypothetical protein FHL15_007591 [Xylaria flabelliformis]
MAFVNRDRRRCNSIDDYKRHALFAKRLTSIDIFQSALQNSAFVALDTESLGQDDRVLCQVGIAYSSSLVPVSTDSISGRRSLQEFAQQNGISSTTMNVTSSTHKKRIPKRIQSRFGNECNVDFDCLDERINKLLLEYNARRIVDNKDRLILVVFEYRAEWSYMARFFPSALRYFSAWLDVIDLSREVAPGGNVPSLKKTLNPLGYSLWDVTHDRKSEEGAAHNAGNDAVITLAVLEGLQWPANQAKLRSLQAYWRIISSHRGPPNLLRMPFTANIQTLDQTLLPKSLDSALFYGKQLVVTSLYDQALALAETETDTLQAGSRLLHDSDMMLMKWCVKGAPPPTSGFGGVTAPAPASFVRAARGSVIVSIQTPGTGSWLDVLDVLDTDTNTDEENVTLSYTTLQKEVL